MSKEISVIIPDDYYVDNVIERIKKELNQDPKVIVIRSDKINDYISKVIQAVNDFQQKLKEISQDTDHE